MEILDFGTDARLYRLTAGGTRLAVTDAGAAVVSLVYKGVDVVLGWEDPDAYARNDPCFGATVGRCANRVAGARFELNGRSVSLARNDGPNNLHSGPDGWHLRRWTATEAEEDRVTFTLESPDGDQGFPGRVTFSVTYRLREDRVSIEYRAIGDADTVLNPTNHTYFNLNGHASGTVENHSLRLFADRFTPSGPGLIPTGEIVSVAGTPFDFREGHRIGRDIGEEDTDLLVAGGYDHNFCLNGVGRRPAAELRGDQSGIHLTVITDRPGIQVYTGNFLGGEKGRDGVIYARRDGVCLETQSWPDAVHQPRFPSVILKAGQPFRSETIWVFRGGPDVPDPNRAP